MNARVERDGAASRRAVPVCEPRNPKPRGVFVCVPAFPVVSVGHTLSLPSPKPPSQPSRCLVSNSPLQTHGPPHAFGALQEPFACNQFQTGVTPIAAYLASLIKLMQ